MNPRQLIRAIAAVAILAIPAAALAAPDQNTNGNGPYYNNGQWNNGQNNGNWDGRHRHRDRDNDGDRDDNGRHRGWYQGRGNPHGYNGENGYNDGNGNNRGYGNGYGYGGYGNRNGQLGGTVSSFSPYNLYLNNGTHVVLHDGTVINPTGINLTGGQRVRVYGSWNQDGTFAANQIDVVANGYRY